MINGDKTNKGPTFMEVWLQEGSVRLYKMPSIFSDPGRCSLLVSSDDFSSKYSRKSFKT